MESIYQWKIKGLVKKVDPEKAIQEIKSVENLYGKITAENVLMYATDEKSELHPIFEWDDAKAGHQYRIKQAGMIINNIEIKVISNNEPRFIPVFEIVKVDSEPQYKHIDSLTYDEKEQVINSTISIINTATAKLNFLQHDLPIIKAMCYLDLAKLVLQNKQN